VCVCVCEQMYVCVCERERERGACRCSVSLLSPAALNLCLIPLQQQTLSLSLTHTHYLSLTDKESDGVQQRALLSPLPARDALPAARGQELPTQPEVCALQESQCGFGSEGPQALLPLARLRVRQVRFDRGEAARHGGAGGAAEAAGAGGAAGDLPRGRSERGRPERLQSAAELCV